MEKFLAKARVFLEKYVQFIALGVAGLVLFWILFTYVLNPAATSVELSGQDVGPGDVDSRVLSTSGDQLEREMTDPAVRTALRPDDVADYLNPPPIAPITPMASDSRPSYVIVSSPTPLFEREADIGEGDGIATLPDLPPAEIVRVAAFKTNADVPPEPEAEPRPEDVVGVVVRWKLPMRDIRERFRQVSIPARISSTTLLDVRLVRERKLSNGEFGERQDIGRLRNASWSQIPAGDADIETKRAYREFALQNPLLVALPPFYPVISGESPDRAAADPVEGGEAEPDAVRPRPTPRPNPGNPGRPGQGGPRGAGPGGPSGYPGSPGSNYPPPRDGDLPPGVPPGARYPGQSGSPDAEGGGYDPTRDGGLPPTSNAPIFVGGEVPGEFNPANATGDVEGWSFDETVVPGETYRYTVTYALRNPLFDTTNIADDPALAAQLSLVTPRDEAWNDTWSEPITIEPIVRWFMRNAGTEIAGRLQNARFSIFRWQNGSWHEDTFTATAGDPLGSERDGIDYTTKHFLVDVRRDPATGESVAVVAGDEGGLVKHQTDEDDSEAFNELQKLVRRDAVAAGS